MNIMNIILEKKIPVDGKIKLYNNNLLQFKRNYDSDVSVSMYLGQITLNLKK